MDCCTILLEERVVPLVITVIFENGAGICALHLSEFVPERTMGPTILVVLIAHHTASLTACNGTSYIN
jgi:hypothetical protein